MGQKANTGDMSSGLTQESQKSKTSVLGERLKTSRELNNINSDSTVLYGKYIHVNKKKRLKVTESNGLTVSVFGDPAEGLHPLQRTCKTNNFSSLGLVHGGFL